MKILYGKPVVKKLTEETQHYIEENNLQGKKVSLFLLSDDVPSRVYVGLKKKRAEKLGLIGEIIEDTSLSFEELLDMINKRNHDPECLGMVVQLPLPKSLQPKQLEILASIDPWKDLDGLGGRLWGLSETGLIDVLPATPKAVVELLDYYDLGSVSGKTVLILGQSNLIGKPLAGAMMKRGATVISANAKSDQAWVKTQGTHADIIISATGVVHLVNNSWNTEGKSLEGKTYIDVGRGIKDGKAVGDIDWEYFASQGSYVTPVPGGIGPITVACLFHNIAVLGGVRGSLPTL